MKFSRVSSLAMLALLSGGGVAVTSHPAIAQLSIGIGISVAIAPPELPVYAQPPLPAPDYIWVPGYWAWDQDVADYYWVPGTWAQAPEPGYLWTPGYWGWESGAYAFHPGYWGPHVGYYGGINYGYGYTGSGFQGGYWQGPHYYYNRSVNNFGNVHVTNVYNKTIIINRTTINNVSYNGGNGGVQYRPSAQELAAEHERHIQATGLQTQHVAAARANHALFFKANHGVPAVAATARPGDFKGPGVVRASNAARPEHAAASPAHGPENTPMNHPEATAAHPQAAKPPAAHSAELPPTHTVQPRPETAVRPGTAMQPRPPTEVKPRPETEVKPRPEAEIKPRPEAEVKQRPEAAMAPRPAAPHPVVHSEGHAAPHPAPHPASHPEAPRPESHDQKKP